MNTKISDEAIRAAAYAIPASVPTLDIAKEVARIAISAALPHLYPQPAELSEVSGEMVELCGRTYLRSDVESALAATGKQQVGDGIAETLEGVKAKLHPMEWSILMAGLSDARAAKQVGGGMVEIQISDAKALCAYVTHSPRSALAARRVAELIGERNMRTGDA